MATFTMIPQFFDTPNDWLSSEGVDGQDFVDAVSTNDNGTSFIYETLRNSETNFAMSDPDVLENSIDFDETVSVQMSVYAHHTGTGTITLDLDIYNPAVGITLPLSSVAVANDTSYPAYPGSAYTVKSIGTPWDYDALKGIFVNLECKTNLVRFQYVRVTYITVVVTYTVLEGVSATFFGANF